ncbi:glycosyltransferase [Microbacterium gallinarum]|uniref:Glycosyltransferase n=1 Tax=Microbacterium gallinarum TaxID=2762209 RepID=A0ABR8WZ64_9MICO|nr:glycosyltransferase [Microbacterium gallinarum]MBD8022237.1 glycosyltransferase [Microbacterium gallinarum]
MRILIITPWFPTAEAPQQGLFVHREALALSRSHDVHVLHLDWTGPADANPPGDAGFGLERLSLRRARPLDYLRARRAVRAAGAGADVVHTHALTLLIPWVAGRPTRKPWVHSEHWSGLTSPETLSRAERVVARILRPALARPDVVVTESSRLTRAVARTRSGPTELVPCIVPEVSVQQLPERRPLRLIGIGGLIPRKGPLLAVSALAELRARGEDAELVWVGDGPEREPVIAAADALGLGGRVRLTGVLEPTAVGQELDAAHLLLLPTQGDNFCVVAAEALVHGRPLVSGAQTGAVDYALPSVSRFVTEQTGSAYAEAVLDVRRTTAGMSAADIAATVADRFSEDTVARALERVYATAAAR